MPCGSRASTAKYQSKYQSGRGSAAMMLGSGGLPSSGGPNASDSKAIAAMVPTPNTTSRQAASGQNGQPSFFISDSYSCR